MISLFIFKSNARGMQYGIGSYVHELTESLLKYLDIEVFVVSNFDVGIKEYSLQKRNHRYTEIRIPSPLLYLNRSSSGEKKYASAVVRILSKLISQTERVIFQFNYLDYLPIILSLKKSFNFPIISVVHFAQWHEVFEGNEKRLKELNIDKPSNNNEFAISWEREMYRQSDHIVSVTSYMKDFLVNEFRIQPDKISVIRNGLNHINTKPFSAEEEDGIKRRLGFDNDEIVILFSGRIDHCKGITFLLEAFERACNRNNNLRLVLMGQGDISICQKTTHSFFGKISYTGFLSKEEVFTFYRIADIGIVPSIYDHCPYSVLEMMANRIPIIMSRINGLDELLTDNQCLFINPVISSDGAINFNIDEISEAILSLAEDDKRRSQLAENAYVSYEAKFKASIMGAEMHRLLINLTNHEIF